MKIKSMFAAVACACILGFTACGNSAKCTEEKDSTCVVADSCTIDSIVVDSLTLDSTVVHEE